MPVLELLGYIASIFMGLSLGMIGGGGSILTVPILVYLFGVAPLKATGYSLFIVGISALVGSLTSIKQKRVDFKTVLLFGLPSLTGVLMARRFILPLIPDNIFEWGSFHFTKDIFIMIVFAALMIMASFSMIKSGDSKEKATDSPSAKKSESTPQAFGSPQKKSSEWRSYLMIAGEGIFVGGITGIVGAGGGFLIIPALVLLRGLPMKIAVGTSLLIIAIKSLSGFIGDLQSHPDIQWPLLLTISAIAIAGIFIGGSLSHKTDEKLLKKAFGYFVLIMGSLILIQQILMK